MSSIATRPGIPTGAAPSPEPSEVLDSWQHGVLKNLKSLGVSRGFMVRHAMIPLTPGGISSESQDTTALGEPQAAHPTPPRQGGQAQRSTARVHRQRHPL